MSLREQTDTAEPAHGRQGSAYSKGYGLIGAHRAELMGIAIIWVCLFHSKVSIPQSPFFYPIRVLKETGYAGVDIFLFLSGFGLMHGMLQRKYSLWEFYRRRLVRVLPAYWLIVSLVILADLVQGGRVSCLDALLKLSTLGFWANAARFDWYIPSLLALYAGFPLLFRAYGMRGNKTTLTALLAGIALSICCVLIPSRLNYLLIFVSRIPVFVIGAYLGYLCSTAHPELGRRQLLFHLFCMLSGFTTLLLAFLAFSPKERWDYGVWWYPFILITVPACLLLSMGLAKLGASSSAALRKVKWFVEFCGEHSLEVYLLHCAVLIIGKRLWPSAAAMNVVNEGHFLEYSLYFAVALVLCVPLRKASYTIQNMVPAITQRCTPG